MKVLKWDSGLETGVELIDNQHKDIIKNINSFLIAYNCGNTYKKTKECLEFLQHYILYHFQTEEAFQVECSYPAYRSHQAKHGYLSTQLKFHTFNIEESNFSIESVTAFYDFLSEWTADHILTEDKDFAAYYKNSNINL